MLKGLICYDKERYSKNIFFANELKIYLNSDRIQTEICFTEDIESFGKIDFVVMRTNLEGLTKKLEDNNIRVFNNSRVSEICNDKHKTYQFFNELGLGYMPYKLIKRANYLNSELCFPLVIKSRFGHGGSQVFMAENYFDIENAFTKWNEETLIAQKAAKTLGKDKRIYVLGGKIFKAVLRTSEKDFRSNYSLGGNICITKATRKESRVVETLLKNIQINFAGIDFIYDGNEPVLNEIEDIAGYRMLYNYRINVAKTIADYIIDTLIS